MVATASALLSAYEGLLDLSGRQVAALEDGNLTEFEALSAHRDAVFTALQAMEEASGGLSPEARERLAGWIPRILANDARTEALLKAASAATLEELAGLQSGLSALHAYVQEHDQTALFIDRSS